MSPETVQLPTAEEIREPRPPDVGLGRRVLGRARRSSRATRRSGHPADDRRRRACSRRRGARARLRCRWPGPGDRRPGRARRSVVLSDVAPEMVAIAAARAARRDQAAEAATQVSAQVLDLEQIDLPDASFDVVVCREGLMFALDPARAASEIARVLRPGGRAAFAVWGPRDRNPWLGVLADAVQEHTGTPVPPPVSRARSRWAPTAPSRRHWPQRASTRSACEEVDVPTHDASFEDYWQLRTDLAGPLKRRLAGCPPGLDPSRDGPRTSGAVPDL